MKGDNNSLKKKVQSLQIDFEKLSRKVSTTCQNRSSGSEITPQDNSADEPFSSQFNKSTTNQEENSSKAKTVNGPSMLGDETGGGDDLHNQSIRSDFLQS